MTQPLNDPTSPTVADLRAEIRDESLARAADILDALPLFGGTAPRDLVRRLERRLGGRDARRSPAETTPAPGLTP